MAGDCSIRIEGLGFTAEQIAACAARQGLLSVELELSDAARCDCAYCRANAGTARGVLSTGEIRTLFTQTIVLGCRRAILVHDGATPFSNLPALIAELCAAELEIELFARVESLPPQSAAWLSEQQVHLSLAPGSLASHPREIEDLCRAGYTQPGMPRLAVRMDVDPSDPITALETWRRARSLGVLPHVQIIKPRGDDHSRETAMRSATAARAMYESLAAIDDQEFGIIWPTPPALIGRSCKRHLFACHVTACGLVFACVGVTIPIGDLRTTTLREIVADSEILENLRDYHAKVKEPCQTCSLTTDCYGCRGAAYQQTGDYLAGDEHCWKAGEAIIPRLPLTVVGIIPHGPAIQMVDRLVRVDERRARTDAVVPADSPWLDSVGRLDDFAYIEMIAQTFAASHGFHVSKGESQMQRGMLLGIKDMVISGEARPGDRLTVDIHKVTRFGGFGVIDGEVRHEDGRVIATGQVKVWRPDDDAQKALFP